MHLRRNILMFRMMCISSPYQCMWCPLCANLRWCEGTVVHNVEGAPGAFQRYGPTTHCVRPPSCQNCLELKCLSAAETKWRSCNGHHWRILELGKTRRWFGWSPFLLRVRRGSPVGGPDFLNKILDLANKSVSLLKNEPCDQMFKLVQSQPQLHNLTQIVCVMRPHVPHLSLLFSEQGFDIQEWCL